MHTQLRKNVNCVTCKCVPYIDIMHIQPTFFVLPTHATAKSHVLALIVLAIYININSLCINFWRSSSR